MYESWISFEHIGLIKFPKRMDINHYENTYDYGSKGMVITNLNNGEHYVIKNPIYEEAVQCPGSYMNSLQYQYLCMHRIGKIADFLTHFPKQKSNCDHFNKQYMQFINELHEFYMEKYVWKYNTGHLNEDKYEHIADVLHKIHLKSLSKYSQGIIKITKSWIKEYFLNKTPEELIFLLNYDRRKLSTRE
jgi:hypothetical protein